MNTMDNTKPARLRLVGRGTQREESTPENSGSTFRGDGGQKTENEVEFKVEIKVEKSNEIH
jgi:hypothetical protein